MLYLEIAGEEQRMFALDFVFCTGTVQYEIFHHKILRSPVTTSKFPKIIAVIVLVSFRKQGVPRIGTRATPAVACFWRFFLGVAGAPLVRDYPIRLEAQMTPATIKIAVFLAETFSE